MKKAIVSYPNCGSTTEVERELMYTIADMMEYFRKFPERNVKMIKDNFRRELRLAKGKPLLINPAGGFCIETDQIKIVKILP